MFIIINIKYLSYKNTYNGYDFILIIVYIGNNYFSAKTHRFLRYLLSKFPNLEEVQIFSGLYLCGRTNIILE